MPAVILLGAFGAALAFGMMISCLEMAERAEEHVGLINGFDAFVERVKLLCSGGPGSSVSCRLDVGQASVLVDGKTLKLVSGGRVVRSGAVPVPFCDRSELRSGEYLIVLVGGACGAGIKVSPCG